MKNFWCALYIVGFVLSFALNTAAIDAEFRGEFNRYRNSNRDRHDAGAAVIFAALASVIWPLGDPLVFCLTGFYAHGLSFTLGEPK